MSRAWINTSWGHKFYPLDPDNPESSFDVNDIFFALARTFRFGRMTDMTVAQHSVAVSYMVPEEFAGEALIHDFPEALSPAGDIPRPIKSEIVMDHFRQIEDRLARRIYSQFGVDPELTVKKSHEVELADQASCYIEAKMCFGDQMHEDWSWDWLMPGATDLFPHAYVYTSVWGPHKAENYLRLRFFDLVNKGLLRA